MQNAWVDVTGVLHFCAVGRKLVFCCRNNGIILRRCITMAVSLADRRFAVRAYGRPKRRADYDERLLRLTKRR